MMSYYFITLPRRYDVAVIICASALFIDMPLTTERHNDERSEWRAQRASTLKTRATSDEHQISSRWQQRRCAIDAAVATIRVMLSLFSDINQTSDDDIHIILLYAFDHQQRTSLPRRLCRHFFSFLHRRRLPASATPPRHLQRATPHEERR